MIVTDKKEYADYARYLTTQAKDDPLRYIHNDIGYNFRMTNIQAALGVAQLEKLDEYIKIKKKNYLLYKKSIDTINGLLIAETPGYANSNYWFYCLQIDEDKYGMNREELLDLLLENGIQTRPAWHPNHMQKPYKDHQIYKIEKTVELWGKTLNIPCSVSLQDKDIDRIVGVLDNG